MFLVNFCVCNSKKQFVSLGIPLAAVSKPWTWDGVLFSNFGILFAEN